MTIEQCHLGRAVWDFATHQPGLVLERYVGVVKIWLPTCGAVYRWPRNLGVIVGVGSDKPKADQ